jgi:tetraacyldisaccharide 4'-kinase
MLRVLLFPVALLYDIITSIRNRLYDMGYKPSTGFDIPVIGVGNLAVGGTGKTPMIEYLIRLLAPNYSIATLSRGYGRKTKGFRVATKADHAATIGDEPYQFYKKFQTGVVVAVGEERALAIPLIIDQHPETNVILMDDAYQHRKVKPCFQLVLTDYSNPFYNDLLLPAGRLRESRKGIVRADVVIVTKCPPDISEEEKIEIERSIRYYTDKPVFFTKIRYGVATPLSRMGEPPNRVILVTGIANHKPLLHYVDANFELVQHVAFPDHHAYTVVDLKKIVDLAVKENAVVFTTEKDAVKLEGDKLGAILSAVPFFYLPIEMEFLKNGKDFDEMILNVLQLHAS